MTLKNNTFQLELTQSKLEENPFWSKPLKGQIEEFLTNPINLDLFDQNGYHMTKVEMAYSISNGYYPKSRREECVISKPWFVSNRPVEGVHLNHAELYQRRGFSDNALGQLKDFSLKNPMLFKLISMSPKWGIDMSIDYVDRNGNVFEVFHYEWDSFNPKLVLEKKKEIEDFVLSQDWSLRANQLIEMKNEWKGLDFFGQSKWKTDFFGLSPEKFKNIVWE